MAMRTVMSTSLLETHGDQPGVRKATSELLSMRMEKAFAVFLPNPIGHRQRDPRTRLKNEIALYVL